MSNHHICKICGKSFYRTILYSHLTKEHNISIQEYYNLLYPDAIKQCIICNKDLKVYKLSRGYGTTCSKSCAAKTLLNTMIKNNPNHQSVVGKLGMISFQSSVANFKKLHNGMSYPEWILFNHQEFQKLNPISQDTRFFYSKNSGIIMDFSLPQYKICIELDGWGHNHIKDEKRDKWLFDTHGWGTFRFKNKEVIDNVDLVVQEIIHAV